MKSGGETIKEAKKSEWQRAIKLLEKDFEERKKMCDTRVLPGLLVAIQTLRLYDDGREF